jgi:hypothetical protein
VNRWRKKFEFAARSGEPTIEAEFGLSSAREKCREISTARWDFGVAITRAIAHKKGLVTGRNGPPSSLDHKNL